MIFGFIQVQRIARLKMNTALTYFSKFRLILLTAFPLLLIQMNGRGQGLPPKPAVCTTPPAGYLIGGDFVGASSDCTSPQTGEDYGSFAVTNITDGAGAMNAVSYYFGLTDSIDITSSGFKPIVAALNGGVYKATSPNLAPGQYWVVQIGEKGGQKYLRCKTRAVYDRSMPVANIFTCDGSNVQIEIPDVVANQHDKYVVDWGDGTVEDIVINGSNPRPVKLSKSYNGTLGQVSITGFYNWGGTEVCTTFPNLKNPGSPDKPVINNVALSGGGNKVEIGYKGFTGGTEYEIEYSEDNGGAPNWKSAGKTSDGSFTMGGLDSEKKYCFRIRVTTECGEPLYSNTVCNITASSTLASSSDVTIEWELPANPTGIPQSTQLIRTTDSCSTCPPVNLPLTSTTDLSFRDQSISCTEKYTYRVVTRYAVTINGKTEFINITSDEIKVDPMDASVKIIPDGLVNVGYQANDESMVRLVVYTESEVNKYQFFHKAPDESDFVQIGFSPNNSFEDISVKPSKGSYCYKYSVEDACGVSSDESSQFCTVYLSYQGNVLDWTDYSFPDNLITKGPARYTVQMFDPSIGSFIPVYRTNDLAQGVGQFLADSEEPEVKFRILAEQFLDLEGYTNFAFPSFSNTVTIPVPADVFVPSAFSPNGDGQNENFDINAKFVDSASIVIFDRWGGIVFEGNIGGRSWNGTDASGQTKLPAGSYTYRIRGISLAGEEFSKTGTITLLR